MVVFVIIQPSTSLDIRSNAKPGILFVLSLRKSAPSLKKRAVQIKMPNTQTTHVQIQGLGMFSSVVQCMQAFAVLYVGVYGGVASPSCGETGGCDSLDRLACKFFSLTFSRALRTARRISLGRELVWVKQSAQARQ